MSPQVRAAVVARLHRGTTHREVELEGGFRHRVMASHRALRNEDGRTIQCPGNHHDGGVAARTRGRGALAAAVRHLLQEGPHDQILTRGDREIKKDGNPILKDWGGVHQTTVATRRTTRMAMPVSATVSTHIVH